MLSRLESYLMHLNIFHNEVRPSYKFVFKLRIARFLKQFNVFVSFVFLRIKQEMAVFGCFYYMRISIQPFKLCWIVKFYTHKEILLTTRASYSYFAKFIYKFVGNCLIQRSHHGRMWRHVVELRAVSVPHLSVYPITYEQCMEGKVVLSVVIYRIRVKHAQ